jgi:Putative metallopeptidase
MSQRMTDFAWRVCPAALALLVLVLFAEPAAIAQVVSDAAAARKHELEQRVLDVAHMFQNDPRYNKGKTPEQIKDSVEFVTGNVLFVLGHETAHALISVFGIPVIGKEEDGADALATIVALKMGSSFAERVVANAARGWFLSDQRDRKEGNPSEYYDEHGLDLQRAYNIVCLMVGAAPDKFMGLANEVKLPEERQSSCHFDFSNASWSWEQVLKPHLRKPEDLKTIIQVNYALPSEEFANLAALGRRLQILESVAAWLSEDYAWTTPISLEMQECGGPDARWLPKEKKVVVCYEMIREFVQLYRNYGQATLVPGTMKMTKYKKIVVAAAKPGSAKSRTGKAFRAERKPH